MSPVTGHHFPIHKACPNHFWRSPHIYQFLLTRNFSGLSDKLHQAHRVKEIHHLTHHGKVTSQCCMTLFEVCIINMLCIFQKGMYGRRPESPCVACMFWCKWPISQQQVEERKWDQYQFLMENNLTTYSGKLKLSCIKHQAWNRRGNFMLCLFLKSAKEHFTSNICLRFKSIFIDDERV